MTYGRPDYGVCRERGRAECRAYVLVHRAHPLRSRACYNGIQNLPVNKSLIVMQRTLNGLTCC